MDRLIILPLRGLTMETTLSFKNITFLIIK